MASKPTSNGVGSDRKRTDNLLNMEAIAFQIRESYKTARTNIAYSIIKKGCKKISFTSANKSEGKTVTSVNIAIALSQQVNTRVLIIDCDLRRPQIHNVLSIGFAPGVTNYLNGECTKEEVIRSTKITNLYAVTYGAIPPNPSELIGSPEVTRFIERLNREYDYIIFDSPPVGVVADALLLKEYIAGYILVTRERKTTHGDIEKLLQNIKVTDSKPLGFIRVGVTREGKRGKRGYYYYYYYQYY